MRWFWGALITLLGVYFLGVNFGWWVDVDLGRLWSLWPIVLVLLGISILTKRYAFGWIVTLIASLLAIVFAIGWLFNSPWSSTKSDNRKIEETYSENLPGDVNSADVSIQVGATELNINGKASEGKFVEGSSSTIFKPTLTVTNKDGVADMEFDMGRNHGRWRNSRNFISLRLTERVPLNLTIDAGASKMNLDLSELMIKSLNLNTGAVSVDARFGEKIENEATATIKTGVSDINLSAPKSVGVKIESRSALTGNDFEGLKQIDQNNYESEGFSGAAKKLTIKVEAGISSIRFNQY